MIALALLVACGEPEEAAETPDVRFNELLSVNAEGLEDEHGEADDWIELAVPEGADLTDWTLILDVEDAEGLVLPALEAGLVLIVADGTPDQGELHAPFTLDAGGGLILLLDAEGALVDERRFPILGADVSWARQPDGDWTYAHEPTPGDEN